MYRRPKFLETLIDIRLEMAEEAGQDVDIFVETVRTGKPAKPVNDTTVAENSQRIVNTASDPRPVAK